MLLSGQILLLHLVEGAGGQERGNAVWETERNSVWKIQKTIISGSHGRCPGKVVEG